MEGRSRPVLTCFEFSKQEAYLRLVMSEPVEISNEDSQKSDLRELVRRAVKDNLNGLFEAWRSWALFAT